MITPSRSANAQRSFDALFIEGFLERGMNCSSVSGPETLIPTHSGPAAQVQGQLAWVRAAL
jgi:hypothetical protein